jgi:hypothetical protein
MHSFGGTGTAGTGADFFGEHGSRDRGAMVGVYAYAELVTGAVSRVAVLNRDDVHAARDAGGYKADDPYSPWNRLDAGKDHPGLTGRSMWWKTAARRLEPWVPTSAEYRREQLRAAAAAYGTVDPQDGSPPVPVNAAQAAQLAESGISTDVHDAELVEEQPARKPRPAGKAALDRLQVIEEQLGLTDTEDLYAWLCAGWSGTGSEVQHVTAWLADHMEAAQGDPAVAAVAIWAQYHEQQDPAAE